MRDLSDMNAMRRAAEPDPGFKARQAFSGIFWVMAGLCFIGVFVTGFGMDTFMPDGFGWLLPALFGGIFLFAGIGAALGGGSVLPLGVSAIGFAVAGFSVAYGLGGEALRAALISRALPLALIALFPAVGLGLLIVPGAVAKKKAAAHPVEVHATVYKKELHTWVDRDHHHHRGYRLTWKYYAGGKERFFRSNMTRNPERREVGDAGLLYLSETDPGDAWEKPTGMDVLVTRTVGIVFMVVGGVALAIFAANIHLLG